MSKTGQQFLADLKRLENVLHKHLSVQGEHTSLPTNAYVIAQALTSILTKNMCFGNSAFRCWSWSGAHAEDQSMAWGRTHTAVRQFLSDSHPASLQGLDQMNQVCQHFQEGTQADVGDFVGHLWHFARGTFFGGKFLHVHQNGSMEEREQVPLNMIFPPGQGILTLDEIVNQWADEDGGQFLYGAPGALILHLQRSVQVEGVWTKHDRELEILNIPFTEDGSHFHMANFKVVSMILHLGQGHENGHYVAIHSLDNAYWWADDDKYPTPIEHLTEQHRREVVQIWLVHDHSGELVPDTVEALEPSAPKKANFTLRSSPLSSGMSPSSGAGFKTGFGPRENTFSSFKKPTSGQRRWKQHNNTSTLEVGGVMAFLPTTLAGEEPLAASLSCMATGT